MGYLLDGKWIKDLSFPTSKKGEFTREASKFSSSIGDEDFPAASGRYHLYISYACPWAHRTVIFHRLKGLEDVISVSSVEPFMGENGWSFSQKGTDFNDPLYGEDLLSKIYLKADAKVSTKVTVPILWDKLSQTIVNNESSQIIRMLNSNFNDFAKHPEIDFYPKHLRSAIDRLNEMIYENINNGVYRCGFAKTQAAYDEAFNQLFDTLDEINILLRDNNYLAGDNLTEADWRLFTTLIRFDAVYFGHFKCNKRRIIDYEHLANYLRKLYHYPGVADTVKMEQIKGHYYASHPDLNPSGIIPLGPELQLT